MRYFVKIPGQKVYLSPICKQDMEIYTKWINNRSVSDNLGNTCELIGIDKEIDILDKLSKDGFKFGIVSMEDNELMGSVNLFDISQIHRRAQCGIFIGEEGNRNKGYGQEALELLLRYAFDVLNLNNVMLTVFSFNEIAIACYKKLGFKVIGERRNSYFLNGKYHDMIFMDILPEDFKEREIE